MVMEHQKEMNQSEILQTEVKIMERLEIDFEIPDFLENDINNYISAMNEQSLDWDCWWGEVYGSINMALYGNFITKEQADLLRSHYLCE